MRTREKAKILKGILLIFLAVFFVASVSAVFGSADFQNINIDLFFYLLGKLAGLFGFLSLSLLIFSGETARFFDRFFGMDKIIKFQRKFSLVTAAFVLLHPIFFIISGTVAFPYLVPDFTVIPLALGIISLYIFVIVMACSLMYKRVSYRSWQYIHIFTYLLFFFSLYHAKSLGHDYSFLPLKIIFWILFSVIIMGIIYRTSYKIKNIYAGKFFVERIINETKNTFTAVIRPEKPFKFKAGQFYFLRLNKDKLYARHPFSVSSAPWENELNFTVKMAGRFTKAMSELKNGEEIIVEGPFGIFTVEDMKKNLVFIAGGVGITPFMSMINDNFKKERPQDIILLYGSKSEEDIIFKNKLDSIQESWLKTVYVVERGSGAGFYETGYINKETIRKYVPDTKKSLFFICGPETMKKSLKKILIDELEADRRNIMIEDFFW